MIRYALFAFAAMIVLAGCGGNSSSSSPTGSGLSYGPLSVVASGSVKTPVTMQGSYSTVTGVFGTSFSSIKVNLVPESQLNEDDLLQNTLIAFSRNMSPILYDYSNGNLYTVNADPPSLANSCNPCFSTTGELVASSESSGGQTNIYFTNIDGSGRTRVTSNASWSYNPSWSSTGKIAFDRNGDIYTINSNGTSEANLTNSADSESYPRYKPNSTKIGYIKYVLATSSYEFWEMNADGSSPAKVATLYDLSNVGFDYSPDGNTITYLRHYGTTYAIQVASLTTGNSYAYYTSTDQLSGPTFSPTGGRIAFIRLTATPTLETIPNTLNGSPTILSYLPWSTAWGLGSPKWGPAIRTRNMIGTGGSFSTTASGFLYSMKGAQFSSFLAFDAVTPSGVSIDVPPPSGINPSNHIATVTASDSITMLRYINGPQTPKVSVVTPGVTSTYAQGFVASFDGYTGKVAAVLPFNTSAANPKPIRLETSGQVVYKGAFTGLWDGAGKQLSSGPLSEVTFNATTGAVASKK